MSETFIFWLIVAFVIFVLLVFLRKFIGRILLICLFFMMIFFVYKRLNPTGASRLRGQISDLPASLSSNYLIASTGTEAGATIETSETSVSVLDPVSGSAIGAEKDISEEYSWFAGRFGARQMGVDELQSASGTLPSYLGTTGERVAILLTGGMGEIESFNSGENITGYVPSLGMQSQGVLTESGQFLENVPKNQSPTDFDSLVLDPIYYEVGANAQGMIVITKKKTTNLTSSITDKGENVEEKNEKPDPSVLSSQKEKAQAGLNSSDLREVEEIFNL